MLLLTEAQRRRLRANAQQSGIDRAPAVSLFRPPARQSWRFTEQRAGIDTLFGLYDPGCSQSGCASLAAIAAVRIGPGLRIERDRRFCAKAPLPVCAGASQEAGQIAKPGPEFEAAPARHEANRERETRQAAFIRSGR